MAKETPGTPPRFTCPSCGVQTMGDYCSACGEKKLGVDDHSLKHYFDVAAEFLTHFDSKGYRSLWYLVTRPGFLSEEQLRGARTRYAKPFSIFVSLNVVYYLTITIVGTNLFSTPLNIQLTQNDYYATMANSVVDEQLIRKQLTYPAYEAKYNERANVLSKTLLFLFIPIFAVLLYAMFFRKRKFIVDHAIIATHLWSFILVLLIVAVPAMALVLKWWYHEPSLAAAVAANDGPITLVLQLGIGIYLALMMRRVYAANIWYCVAMAALIAWSFFHIVWLYRFLQFIVTVHSL